MALLKLHIDEFDEVDYELIAIHSTLEEHRLAYLINQKLPINLNKSKDEISVTIKEGEVFFIKYVFSDQNNEVLWSLIQNKNEINLLQKSTDQNLFLNINVEVTTKVYLLSELKKVDYFLKIENNRGVFSIDEIMSSIKLIDRISAVYIVNPEKIKSKNNLIF